MISPPVAGATVGTWTLDPDATTVSVSVKKLAVFTITAELRLIDGQVDIDAEGRVTGVAVSIDAASYQSPNDKRNEHVRGPDFLDSENHPVLAFRADDIVAADGGYTVRGTVTVKGGQSEVTATVRDVAVQDDAATFALSAALDRKALGVDKLPSFFVGNQLELAVQATARRQPAA